MGRIGAQRGCSYWCFGLGSRRGGVQVVEVVHWLSSSLHKTGFQRVSRLDPFGFKDSSPKDSWDTLGAGAVAACQATRAMVVCLLHLIVQRRAQLQQHCAECRGATRMAGCNCARGVRWPGAVFSCCAHHGMAGAWRGGLF